MLNFKVILKYNKIWKIKKTYSNKKRIIMEDLVLILEGNNGNKKLKCKIEKMNLRNKYKK
jgi:hypothetical protein